MLRKQRGVGLFVLIAGSLILSACGAGQPPATTPTIDANMIYTSAAMTVAAQLTQNAALTPKPSSTPEATATLAIPTADTTLPTLPLPGAATLPPVPGIPTLTPNAAVNPVQPAQPGLPKGYQWISNDPADNTVIVAGTKFDIAWRVKNTGTTTWTTNYSYYFYSGDKFFEKSTYKLRAPVAPGEEVTLLVDGIAPSKSGTYFTWWKLDDELTGFPAIGDMDLTILVVQPGETPKAATATVTPTP